MLSFTCLSWKLSPDLWISSQTCPADDARGENNMAYGFIKIGVLHYFYIALYQCATAILPRENIHTSFSELLISISKNKDEK